MSIIGGMKTEKHTVTVAALLILSVAFFIFLSACSTSAHDAVSYDASSVIRIHIRANGNSDEDQSVKYAVKDAVCAYLAPILSKVSDMADAGKVLSGVTDEISEVATRELRERGQDYSARAALKVESFPPRYYGNSYFPEGEYSALIIELGSGKGDNWWCVVYPPLCFIGAKSNGGDGIVYRSKIAEILSDIFSRW